MNKTFGDLKSGDIIYYIAWDEEKKVYSVFEHIVHVRETSTLDVLGNVITIDIKLRPGDYLSHGVTGLVLSRNDAIRKWSEPHYCTSGKSGGLAITVDYNEAKNICISFMRKHCELMRERSKAVASEMDDAIDKLMGMLRDYIS